MEQTFTLLNGNKIIQDTDGFMFGTDAVLGSAVGDADTGKEPQIPGGSDRI